MNRLLYILSKLHLIKWDEWEYGKCNNRLARRHKINGNVQMILWKQGQQGHKEDYWHDFHSSWWDQFIINNKQEEQA